MQQDSNISSESDEIRKNDEDLQTIYLIERIKVGDEIAFEDFVNKYIAFIVSYVKTRTSDYDAVDQVVIDTFERVYFKMKEFHYTNKKELMSWLICVCRTAIYKYYNTNEVRYINNVVHDDEYIDTCQCVTNVTYLDERIGELTGILDDFEFIIVKEHLAYDTPFSVIGKELGMSVSKVSHIYYKAVEKCKEATKDNKK